MHFETPETPRQFLMLGLADEIFGLDASSVRDILDPVPVTEVPGTRAFARGVINVRGKIVPMTDLRLQFGMAPMPTTRETRFVVLEIDLDGDATIIAIVADKVHEVAELSMASLRDAPRVGMHWRTEYIKYIGKWKDGFIIGPNIERIFN